MSKKLKGAYIARLDLDAPHLAGVSQKIRGQMEALEEIPSEVELYYCSQGRIIRDGGVLASYGPGALKRRFVHFVQFYRRVGSIIRGVDFVYIRYQGSSLWFLRMLSNIRRNNPGARIILEIPSWPYQTEARTLREKFANLVDRITRPGLRGRVDRILTFSKEDTILGIPTVRTSNGVDVQRLAVRAMPEDYGLVRLVGVANLSLWHGYDRVIAGLATYRRQPGAKQVRFDIVGSGAELERLKDQARRSGVDDIVVFHGTATGEKLDAILVQSDIGISSLGMHRLDVDTSNLKSREYCARGIPFAIGYVDPDFPASLPFVFQVPANEDPVDIGALVAFHEALKAEGPGIVLTMRNYAERELTWKAKMRPAVELITHHGRCQEKRA